MTNDLDRRIQDDEISLKELILKIKEWWQYLWSKKMDHHCCWDYWWITGFGLFIY